MHTTRTHRLTTRRRAFSLEDLLWLLFILALLIAILLPSLSRAREVAKRAVCEANLRGIGMGMHIYANDNMEWFPHHYYEPKYDPDKQPPEHGVRWVGTMGSNDFLKITEQTSKTKSPDRSHPSRSLFLLLIGGNAMPDQFVCPSSGDTHDPLRDLSGGREYASQPGINRFDFRGYNHLSYGYQLPSGLRGKPRWGMDPRMAIAADKGPYYAAGGAGLPGSGTIRDTLSDVQPPRAWDSRQAGEILRIPNDEWRRYNSRNHAGEGQNVLFVDGHVSFQKRPIVGVNYDNIYTLQSGYDLKDTIIGLVPEATQPLGPLTNTDSFIVP